MLQKALLIFASKFTDSNLIKCFSLNNQVPTNKYASYSVILSLAAHITYHFPYLDISNFEHKIPKIIPQSQQINEYLTFHPLQQFWCDIFYECILKNHAIRKENCLYIVLELNNSQYKKLEVYSKKMKQFNIQTIDSWIDQILKSVTQTQQLPRKSKKIGFLNVSGSQLRTNPYAPIINVRSIMLGQIYNNQQWLNYNILKGQIPTQQQLLQLDGVIIPGSTNSVLSSIKQIQLMSKNLFNAFQKSQKLKIFGICYGHQLIAFNTKGGQVVKKKRTDKIQKLQFNIKALEEQKNKFPFLSHLCQNQHNMLVVEHHEDYVQKISNDFHILAKSNSSKIECLLHKNGRILSFQSHPQYLQEFTRSFSHRIHKFYDANYNYKNQKRQNQHEVNKIHHESSIRIRKVISQFLNWNN